ncbi:MAG: O-antigen ligase family protein [Desulfobacca sp.]|uniref:O-antigen ligase family protein n=1 Tax=Desulfobacca sp. TaxID=2067990 RepID=UPI00404AB5E5
MTYKTLHFPRLGGLELAIVVGCGLITVPVLVNAFLLPPKWTVFLLLTVCALAGLAMIRRRERFLIYLAVLFMSIYLDFHPYYLHTESTPWPVAGIRISIFDVAFFCLMVAWVCRLVLQPNEVLHFYPGISLPFLLLWGLALLSTLRAAIPLVIKIDTLWMVLQSWLIFLYFANTCRDRRLLLGIMAILLLSGVLQALLGLGQYLSGSSLGLQIFGESKTFMEMRAGTELVSRVAGTFGHPNNLSAYLTMLLMINLALFFATIDLRLKFLLLPVVVLLALANLLTLSRGGWLATAIGAYVTLALSWGRRSQHRLAAFLLAGLILVTFVITSLIFVEPLKRRFFEEDYGAARSRLPMSLVALNIIRHHPFLGVGLTNYVMVAPDYDLTKEAIATDFARPVHNEFLLIAAELGLPALLLFLTILVLLLRQLWRLGDMGRDPVLPYLAIGLLGTYIAWIVFRQTDYAYVLLADPFWILAGLTQAMTAMETRDG